ncbi:MAG: hypothetical protein JSW10_10270, partial [Pseudomonadota bacterium]
MSNRKFVFINPPYERVAPGYGFLKHITNRSPSLGLLHLAAEVRLHGYEPSIIESDIFDLDVEAVAREVIAKRPGFVGITLFTVGVHGAAAIAREPGRRHLRSHSCLSSILVSLRSPACSEFGRPGRRLRPRLYRKDFFVGATCTCSSARHTSFSFARQCPDARRVKQ